MHSLDAQLNDKGGKITFYLLINTGGILLTNATPEERDIWGFEDISIPKIPFVGFIHDAAATVGVFNETHIEYLRAIKKHPQTNYTQLSKLINVGMGTAYLRVRRLINMGLVNLNIGKNGKHLLSLEYDQVIIIDARKIRIEDLCDLNLQMVIGLAANSKRPMIKL